MTAILIANLKEKSTDYLYLVADSRVTDGDRLISDHNKKIFMRQVGKVIRYYATCGDVAPTDYLIDKLDMHVMESIPSLLFEDEILKTVKATFVAFVVELIQDEVRVYEIGIYEDEGENAKNIMYAEKINLEELKYSSRLLGSGTVAVDAALKAITSAVPTMPNEERIQKAFTSASNVVLSINDKIDLYKFKLPKQRR